MYIAVVDIEWKPVMFSFSMRHNTMTPSPLVLCNTAAGFPPEDWRAIVGEGAGEPLAVWLRYRPLILEACCEAKDCDWGLENGPSATRKARDGATVQVTAVYVPFRAAPPV